MPFVFECETLQLNLIFALNLSIFVVLSHNKRQDFCNLNSLDLAKIFNFHELSSKIIMESVQLNRRRDKMSFVFLVFGLHTSFLSNNQFQFSSKLDNVVSNATKRKKQKQND